MKINWRFWGKRKTPEQILEEKHDIFQKKLENIPTIYANRFNEVGIFEGLNIGGVRLSKDGKVMGFESPKMIYGWLDPNSDMEYNKAWILASLKGQFFEISITERISDNKVKSEPGGKAYPLEELINRLKHGDFDEMLNEDTDKNVTEELYEVIKKYDLKTI